MGMRLSQKIGRPVIVYSATDWSTTFVTFPIPTNLGTGSGTTATTAKKDGDSLKARMRFSKDGPAGTGTGTVTFSMPTGLVIDFTKLPPLKVIGSGAFSGATYGPHVDAVALSSTTFILRKAGTAINIQGQEFTAGAEIDFILDIPIVGWETYGVIGASAGSGGLSPAYAAATLTAEANKTYAYNMTAAPYVLTLPAGITAATVKVYDYLKQASTTKKLTVVPNTGQGIDGYTAGDGVELDYAGFEGEFNRPQGSNVWYWVKQNVVLPQPGMMQGYTGSTAIAAGNVGETPNAGVRAATGGSAYTIRASTAITSAGVNLFGGYTFKKGLYLVGFTSSFVTPSNTQIVYYLSVGATPTAVTQVYTVELVSGASANYTVGFSMVPVFITTDDTIIDVRAGFSLAISSTSNKHEMCVVRIA